MNKSMIRGWGQLLLSLVFVLGLAPGAWGAGSPYAATQPVTLVTDADAMLNGMAVPNGLATSAWFEWGTNTAYGNQSTPIDMGSGLGVVLVTNAIGGLTAGVTYHFRLVATNSAGRVNGNDQILALGKKVRGWGYNNNGQADAPTGLSNVVAIAAGYSHNLALKTDGTVTAWGSGYNGATQVPAGLSNAVAIAAGSDHSLALKSDGTMVAWGENYYGQASIPFGLSNVVAIAAGYSHNLALRTDGTLAAWGYNSSGQTNVPAGLSNVVAIAAGSFHSLALKADGTVAVWGLSSLTNVPAGLTNVVAIEGGGGLSLALKADGTVAAWGESSFGQTNAVDGLSNVVAVAVGGYHWLGLRADGKVEAWGYDSYGQTDVPASLSNVVAIAGGQYHSLALGDNERPVAASQTISGPANNDLLISLSATDGNNDSLQFRIVTLTGAGTLYQCAGGNRGSVISEINTVVTDSSGRVIFVPETNAFGASYRSFQFVANDGMADSAAATVTVNIEGSVHAMTEPATRLPGSGATLNGMVLANGMATAGWFEWGTNTAYGNQTEPVILRSGGRVVWVTNMIAGLTTGVTYHFRLVATNSTGAAYGADQMFTLGKKVRVWGSNSSGQADVPAGLGNVVVIAGGGLHSLALKADGTVAAWGYNGYGQTNLPAGLSNVVAIAAGAYHSLALKFDGTVVGWGDNVFGLSDGAAGLSNVVAIAEGYEHSLAVKADGTVVAWGYNYSGQTNVPVGLSNVVAIAGGYYHSLALKVDGTVVGWGDNDFGQTDVPVGLRNVVAIAGGHYHSLALKADGTVAAWGYNGDGQTNVPVRLSTVVAIAGGYDHSLALKVDGTVVGWGNNSYSQTTIPAGLRDVGAIAAGYYHSLALGDNEPPVAASQTVSGPANNDLLIRLSATDVDKDLLQFRIVTLPTAGTLFQCAGGSRGAAISSTDTLVTDSLGRVVFVPESNAFGASYGSFQFVANDGQADSAAAMVTVNIAGSVYAMTQPATQLPEGAVTLNGMALPNGLPTGAWFEWGPTTVYGNKTVPAHLGNGGGVVRVTNLIGGVTMGMTYHFRLVATNSAGTAYGADQMFGLGKKVRVWGSSGYWGTEPVGLGSLTAIAAGYLHSLAACRA